MHAGTNPDFVSKGSAANTAQAVEVGLQESQAAADHLAGAVEHRMAGLDWMQSLLPLLQAQAVGCPDLGWPTEKQAPCQWFPHKLH